MKRIITKMYLCLLAFCITGGISAQTQNSMTEVIPFKTIDGKIIVEATINGEAADFVLDLSGHNALLPEALKKLHINTEKRGTFSSYQDFVFKQVSQSTITANVLAIMSFTLNRVYTEWYRNQGYDFTITSSTAFDHKWIYGRNIFESISQVVDEIFDSFLSRPGVRQPILTQYCDGRQVQCPRWMTQWGSCSLGQQGYSPIEILRYYYGDSIYINTAEQIAGIPASWPGYDLTVGSSGDKVRQLQEQLDAIAQIYTAIPRIQPDGIYGQQTAAAVREFQNIFGLPQTGVTDFATWYKISHIYVGITRIAELY